MRIAHVMSWYVPELGYQENILPREQARLGHSVEIIASDIFPRSCKDVPSLRCDASHGTFSKGLRTEAELRVHRLHAVEWHGLTYMFGLRRRLAEIRPDIVMAHGAFSPDTMRVISYSRSLGYKVFVDDHSLGLNMESRPIADSLYLFACRKFYNLFGDRVSLFLPVTSATLQVLKSVLPTSAAGSEILPLGADTRVFSRSKEFRRIGREQLGLSESDFLVISSGKLLPEKQMILLIEAFSRVAASRPQMKLLILGSGPEHHMRDLTDSIRRLGIDERVLMHEFVPNKELPFYYNAADAGVWPGLPSITVIEAAATGLPIVVPAHETSYKALFEASAVLTYDAPSLESLSESISRLADDESTRMRISDNAEKVVLERLSWTHIAERTLRLFERDIHPNRQS